jgi:serine protease Do
MDNYTNDNQNQSQGNYGNGYPVDPANNSYRYTGTEGAESTGSTYSSTSDSTGSTYSSASGNTNATYSSAYNAYSNGDTDQNQDRYYSPYERRTMEENSHKKKRVKKQKDPNKKHGFGVTIAKCACLAAVFGLVAGGVFGGVNYLIPDKSSGSTEIATEQTAALSTTSGDSDSSTVSTATTVEGSIIATDVSDIVEEAMPCIVAITNMTETQYQTWFGQTYTQESDYAGSGIIVSEDDDYLYIATNNHVVDGAKTLTVQFCDDSTVTAEIKGASATNDLAVVTVDKSDIEDSTKAEIKIARINDDGDEKVGEPVIAIGNALGYGQSVTSGIISALNREVSAEDSTTGETYASTVTQTDASINPGNSGGALLNIKGEVIGINSSKMGGDYVDGVGFAIPMTTAAPIINDLITREKVTDENAGFLGINGYDVDESVSSAYNMPSGIYVAKVYDGSAAAEAGIQQGDIITEFDGQEVSSMEEMQELLEYRAAGTEVTMTIKRANNGNYEEIQVQVTLGKKTEDR